MIETFFAQEGINFFGKAVKAEFVFTLTASVSVVCTLSSFLTKSSAQTHVGVRGFG